MKDELRDQENEKKILDATRRWLTEMNSIPTSVVQDLHNAGHDFTLLNPPSVDPDEEDEEEETRYPTEGFFPMWGTMFTFKDSLDDHWIENNLDVMRDCGFFVYESEHFDYIFGIDGAGYDFYEAHWVPLYKARGLNYHNQ